MTLCSGDLELRKRSVYCLRTVQHGMLTGCIISSRYTNFCIVHDVFVRTCICLGVVDALIAAAIGSSIAFIHRRGLRVVSF